MGASGDAAKTLCSMALERGSAGTKKYDEQLVTRRDSKTIRLQAIPTQSGI
jgi:hypothetical protein